MPADLKEARPFFLTAIADRTASVWQQNSIEEKSNLGLTAIF